MVVTSWLWLLLAGLLLVLPGVDLAVLQMVERPNLTGHTDRPATISTWVVGTPDVGTVLVSAIGTALVVGLGWMAGYWAREKGRYAAVATVAAMTLLGVGAVAVWFFFSFVSSLSAHADFTPAASLLTLVPVVTWLAAAPVAALAGAERWMEDDR